MPKYIDQLDETMKDASMTPSANHLFSTNEEKLDASDAILYHHLVAKLLYLSK